MLAIIGGSGLTNYPGIEHARRHVARTPYGEPSGALTIGTIAGHEIIFLARHGNGHTIPPHLINYRANLWALHEHGASRVVSVATVGGIGEYFVPGLLAVPEQIIDYTYGREATYSGGHDASVVHTDFTEPYSKELRGSLLRSAHEVEVKLHDGGVYACTQGPRLETAAEINRLERDGCDVVGMTGMPEAVLAREIGLKYAVIALVVNPAAGRGYSAKGIDLSSAETLSHKLMQQVILIINKLTEIDGD
jgi:5'-methylthioinosine phosphorylase